MPHLERAVPMMEKHKDKVTGFDVRFLDDDTFILNIQNSDYSKNKTYSYPSFKEMMVDLDKDFGKKQEKKEDNLSKY